MVTQGVELPFEDARCPTAKVLTPDSVLGACREQLHEVDPGARDGWRCCRPIEALYHPGRYLRVAFVLLEDDTIPPERYWPQGQIVYLHGPVRRPISRRGTVVRVNGCDVEAYCFPNDRRLRGLRRIASRTKVARFCRDWLGQSGGALRLDDAMIRRRLIRYVPEQKFVARISGRTSQPASDHEEPFNLALRSASARACAVLARRHEAVAGLAASGSKHLYVPRLVWVDMANGLVALEWMRGGGLLEKLRTGEVTTAMRRMARALRLFHRFPAEGLERLVPADIRRNVEDAVLDLAANCPELKSRLVLLAAALRGRLAEIGTPDRATLHGDLHWNQVRIHQRRYAFLDLERMCVGDPLIDVANFTSQVRMLGHRPALGVESSAAERWAGEFIQQWASATRAPVAPGRLHLYAAVSLLHLARNMMRHLHVGWRALAHRCLEHAESEVNSIGRELAVP
jgi:aminoglycoside phosphotransferase (APT) family kinase protein